MKKIIFILVTFCSYTLGYSQHLYSEKYENCKLERFCLDCGDTKAEPPKSLMNELIDKFDKESLGKIKGNIEVQILIDDSGKPCLLSSLNQTNISSVQLGLQKAINSTSNWEPAISKDKKTNSSVSLVFLFENGNFSAKRKIFDFTNQSNEKSIGRPHVEGTEKNKLSKSWTVFTQENSELPWDMTRAIASDLEGNIWIGTDDGIVKITNDKWEHFNSKNTIIAATAYNKNKTQSVRDLEVDKNNNKWFIAGWDAYKYDNENWTKYDSINSPINWARKIFVDHANNIWFTSWDGVAKFDGKNWSVINKQNSNLPTNKTLGVYVDKKNRIWIGTFEGNVIIENGVTQQLNKENSPLSKAYISKIHEDKNGNLWFDLFNEKSDDAGMYVLDLEGNWTRIIHPNSKMFSENAINDFYLDEDTNLLWITLNGVGVLSYDITSKTWETYTNKNSNVPSIHCERITKDKNGAIWIATYAGVIKLNK
ncbi:MAG: two-component regulator propeller domain-containing protein [Bacteroidota bacterium]